MRIALSLALILLLAAPAGASPMIDLNLRNADLGSAIDLIATQAGINIVIDGSAPTKTVTMRLSHVTLDNAIHQIEVAYGLAGAWDGGVLHLGDPTTINRSYPTGRGLLKKLYMLQNATPDNVQTALTNALPTGTLIVPDKRTNSILIKGSPLAIETANQIIASLDKSQYGSVSYSTFVIPISNLTATEALTALKQAITITAPNTAVALDKPGEVLLTGAPDFVAAARGVLFNITRPGNQVQIEVRVADITPINNSSDIGIQWGGVNSTGQPTPGSGSTITLFTSKSMPINATINALVSQGRASILATPTLTAYNNQPATLNVGEQFPIVFFDAQLGTQQVQFVNAGVNLKIVSSIGDDGWITSVLDVGYSQILSFVQNYPVIGQRQSTTTMRIHDGDTIVLSGLFQDITTDTVTKIPLLGDIPIIGQIFRNRQKTHSRDEIIFLITPHIVTPMDYTRTPRYPVGAPQPLPTP